MKLIKLNIAYCVLLGIIFIVSASACKKLDYFQSNPNNPTQADPSLELTNIEQSLFATISADADLASRYLVYTQSTSSSQYYGWKRSGFNYRLMSQVVKMEQEAAKLNKINYYYLGKFFRSYLIVQMTQSFGDLPYSAAMQAMAGDFENAATHPVYDTQKDIYMQVLDDLEAANDSLGLDAGTISGDIIYDGDLLKWRKLINTFSLRVLMSLSHHTADTDLKIKERFHKIVSQPDKYPVFSSAADNAALNYYDITGNQYPYYNNNSMKTDYYLDISFVHMLQSLKDPRLFVFGEPTTASGSPGGDLAAYDGLMGSAPLDVNNQKKSKGLASAIHKRFAYEATNEPSLMISYSELQFILAEGSIRGWIDKDATTYYETGIRAAMNFANHTNAYSVQDIQSYLTQPAIQLQVGKEIQQIITQKYISRFMQMGWESFYEQRRTGFPEFETTGSGILNNGKIPKRWMYPTDEYNNNTKNVEAAVSRQYGGTDDVNGVMWLIK